MSAAEDERPEKPFGNAFCQATMSHKYAQLSPQGVILCLFIIAVVFIPVGAATIIASDSVYEWDDRYDNIQGCTYHNNNAAETFSAGNITINVGCNTNKPFELKKALVAPIYIYYRMKGFNQNYRLYAKSFDSNQLRGEEYQLNAISDCEPKARVRTPGDGVNITNSNGDYYMYGAITIGTTRRNKFDMGYTPCGAVPWSMFNDTISLYRLPDEATARSMGNILPSTATPICLGGAFDNVTNQPTQATNCEKDGIAFKQDIDFRFKGRYQSDLDHWTGLGFAGTTDNDYFRQGFYDNEVGHRVPVISDQDFMTWMRIAPLGDFRKLYRKITVDLPAGWYAWNILERFDTTTMGAEKHVILATTSWVGSKNHVLGALYLAMGSVSLVLAFGFVGMYLARNKAA